MPTYVYRCPECGDKREISHGMNDMPEAFPFCPKSRKHPLNIAMVREIQPVSFTLKGGGYYGSGRA